MQEPDNTGFLADSRTKPSTCVPTRASEYMLSAFQILNGKNYQLSGPIPPSMNYEEFLKRMKEIKEMGYVKSHRKGDTGIGKTLEDLLGITENNIAGPDFDVYELKSGRKDSVSMLTLFTKTPMPKGAIRNLLSAYGYKQRKGIHATRQKKLGDYMKLPDVMPEEISIGEKELHITVDAARKNSLGLILRIMNDKIHVVDDKNVEAYYEESVLKEAFERKYLRLIYVLASSKREDGEEYLWFDEAYRLAGFSFGRFSELVKKAIIKLDLRVGHYPDGRLHDHGTGFRVLPKYLPECFEKIEKIL
jgi:hypothetical protein